MQVTPVTSQGAYQMTGVSVQQQQIHQQQPQQTGQLQSQTVSIPNLSNSQISTPRLEQQSIAETVSQLIMITYIWMNTLSITINLSE